jgi:hypothetical protein
MEDLSCDYQKGKSDLETTDLTALVIRAMCQCATRAIKANRTARPGEKTQLVVSVEDVLSRCEELAECGLMDPDYLNNQRIGRILNQLRIQEVPRPGGVGSRLKKFSLGDLDRMCESYHLPPPDFDEQTPPEPDGTTGTTGTAGTLGTIGTNGSNGTDAKDFPRIQPLSELEQDECRNGVEENSTPGRTVGDMWGIESLNPAQYGLILLYDEVIMNHQCSGLRYG